MSSVKQPHTNDKTITKQQAVQLPTLNPASPAPLSQLAMIIQQGRSDLRSLSSPKILQLQQLIGNRATSRFLNTQVEQAALIPAKGKHPSLSMKLSSQVIQRNVAVQIEVGQGSAAMKQEQQQKLYAAVFDFEEDEVSVDMEEDQNIETESTNLNPFAIDKSNLANLPQGGGGATVINKVNIGGRPPGLLRGKEGSHTTAWAAFCDAVRSSILDLTPPAAIEQVVRMYNDARNLPGMNAVDKLEGAAKALYENAQKKVVDLLTVNRNNLSPAAQIPYLQELVGAYLHFRNSVPFSQMDDGRATGHGEPAHIDILRQANDYLTTHDSLPDQSQEPIWHALWEMFDYNVVRKLGGNQFNKITAPGVQDLDINTPATYFDNLVAKALVQHIWTMQATYNKVCEAVELDSEDSIKDFLRLKMGYNDTTIGVVYNEVTQIYDQGSDPQTQPNHPLLAPSTNEGKSRFSVQILNNGTDNNIKDVIIGGRPHGLLGSKEGSHLTAFVVFADEVRARLIGKSFQTAIGEIITLANQAAQLPGVQRLQNLDERSQPLYKAAHEELNQLISQAGIALNNPVLALPTLQKLVASYLHFRNCIPLSQTDAGVAEGHGEAQKRARIRLVNGDINLKDWPADLYGPAPVNAQEVLADMWGMFDHEVAYRMAAGHFEKADAPGTSNYDKWDYGLLGDLIKQHLISIQRAYPRAYQETQMGSQASIRIFLSQKMKLDNDTIQKVILTSGLIFHK